MRKYKKMQFAIDQKKYNTYVLNISPEKTKK